MGWWEGERQDAELEEKHRKEWKIMNQGIKLKKKKKKKKKKKNWMIMMMMMMMMME